MNIVQTNIVLCSYSFCEKSKEVYNFIFYLLLKFEGKRFDCGAIDRFVEATNYFYKKL